LIGIKLLVDFLVQSAPLSIVKKRLKVTYVKITDAGCRALKAMLPLLWYIDRAAEGYRLKEARAQRKLEQMIRGV
jgi:hypothetical protein